MKPKVHPKIKKIFKDSELDLFTQFLVNEAKCFGSNVFSFTKKTDNFEYVPLPYEQVKLNQNGLAWIYTLSEKIADEINIKFPEGFDYVILNSFGNAGSLIHSISITPTGKPYWNWKKGNLTINFCTCGHLDHWGSIFQE